MLHKIRINDLARELEVKSKSILDVLTKVGVTEKKTHSSSIEVDEAERVKKYFAEHAAQHLPRLARCRACAGRIQAQDRSVAHLQAGRCVEGDHATRRPARCASRVPVAPASLATPSAPRTTAAPPSAVPPKPAPPSPPIAAAGTQPVTTAEPKPAPRFITPQSGPRPPAADHLPPKPPAPPTAQAAALVAEATKVSEPLVEDQVAVLDEAETAISAPEITASETPVEAAPAAPPALAAPPARPEPQ